MIIDITNSYIHSYVCEYTLMMDKAPEAAAICISAFPLLGSLPVARCRSSCTIAYNGV